MSLGPLEQEVMKCIWQAKICTTRMIVDCLNQNRPIAYNTVQTVMSRLVDKNLLKRYRNGNTYTYQPMHKQRNVLKLAISQAMSGFRRQFGDEALVAFMDGLEDISEDTRSKLIQKLQQK